LITQRTPENDTREREPEDLARQDPRERPESSTTYKATNYPAAQDGGIVKPIKPARKP
jgi:hypothetical protein